MRDSCCQCERLKFSTIVSTTGRAAETLRDLRRHTLEDQPVLPPSRRRATTTSDQSTMWRSSRNTEHCDYTYVAAVDKLRTMLQKHDPVEPKVVQFGASVSQCSCHLGLQFCRTLSTAIYGCGPLQIVQSALI